MFNLYLEELITRIRKTGNGVKVGDRRLGCLAYAGDVILMSENKDDMEKLLQIVDTFGKEWNIRYSTRKCKVMEFGDKEENQWVLRNDILEVIDRVWQSHPCSLSVEQCIMGRRTCRWWLFFINDSHLDVVLCSWWSSSITIWIFMSLRMLCSSAQVKIILHIFTAGVTNFTVKHLESLLPLTNFLCALKAHISLIFHPPQNPRFPRIPQACLKG